MATLPTTELFKGHKTCEKLAHDRSYPVNYTKVQLSAALQAVEDYYEATAKLGFATAIETAAPGVFSNPQKKAIGKAWLGYRFGVE